MAAISAPSPSRFRQLRLRELRDRCPNAAPVPNRKTKILEILLGQVRQDVDIDVVLLEDRSEAAESQCVQPANEGGHVRPDSPRYQCGGVRRIILRNMLSSRAANAGGAWMQSGAVFANCFAGTYWPVRATSRREDMVWKARVNRVPAASCRRPLTPGP